MATAFDTPALPFGESFADLPTQWIEASTRAISASAELYTDVLSTQAEATRALLQAYSGLGAPSLSGLGAPSLRGGAETTERAAETTEQAAEETAPRAARTTRKTTRRAANTKRGSAKTTRRAANATRRTANATRRADKPAGAAGPAQPSGASQPAKPPITGYDGLTADDVVAKLAEQPQTALAEIATYEGANQKRAGVLQRVAALTGPEPAPGYDALSDDDAVELVTNGSPTLAAAVRDYERRHKNRASVVEAATRRASADDAS